MGGVVLGPPEHAGGGTLGLGAADVALDAGVAATAAAGHAAPNVGARDRPRIWGSDRGVWALGRRGDGRVAAPAAHEGLKGLDPERLGEAGLVGPSPLL